MGRVDRRLRGVAVTAPSAMPDESPHSEEEYDETTFVERTDVGVSITTRIKRGTDTRDHDEHEVKSKAYTLAKAIERHDGAIEYVEDDLAGRVRAIQPDDDGEGGDADE